jgi:hypothetical protein
MPNVTIDEPEDKPLDPAMESVRRKMVRTLGISIGIMCVGLMAVLGAIVYKVTARPSADETASSGVQAGYSIPADAPHAARAALPAGFSVEHVSLDGGQVLFYGTTAEGAAHAYVFDIGAGRIIADVSVSR